MPIQWENSSSPEMLTASQVARFFDQKYPLKESIGHFGFGHEERHLG